MQFTQNISRKKQPRILSIPSISKTNLNGNIQHADLLLKIFCRSLCRVVWCILLNFQSSLRRVFQFKQYLSPPSSFFLLLQYIQKPSSFEALSTYFIKFDGRGSYMLLRYPLIRGFYFNTLEISRIQNRNQHADGLWAPKNKRLDLDLSVYQLNLDSMRGEKSSTIKTQTINLAMEAHLCKRSSFTPFPPCHDASTQLSTLSRWPLPRIGALIWISPQLHYRRSNTSLAIRSFFPSIFSIVILVESRQNLPPFNSPSFNVVKLGPKSSVAHSSLWWFPFDMRPCPISSIPFTLSHRYMQH